MEWNDIADVWLYWNDVKSRIIRNVGEKIGFSSGMCTYLIVGEQFVILTLYITGSITCQSGCAGHRDTR